MSKKKLQQNIIYNGIYQVFLLLLPVITIPYVTRIFTADDLGSNSYVFSIVQIFVTIAFFGINQYGSREIAYTRTKKERNQVFWELWFLQIVMTIISYLVFFISIGMFQEKYTPFFFIQGFLILLNMLEVSWFFIGIEEFKSVVIRNTTVKILMTVAIFLFVREASQLKLYMVLNVLGILIGNITLVASLYRKVSRPSGRKSMIITHFKKSSIFLMPQLLVLIYSTLDKTILGALSNMEQVAFYDQSKRIIAIAIGLITSVSTVLLPRMSSLRADKQEKAFSQLFTQAFQYTTLFSFYIVLGVIAVSPSFVAWFFGAEFQHIAPMMQVTAMIGIFIPFGMLMANALLVPLGKERVGIIASTIAAGFSLVLGVICIPIFGAWGAVLALCSAEFSSVLYRFSHAKKYYNFSTQIQFIRQILISFVTSVIIILMLNLFVPRNMIGTIISGGICTISFFGILYFQKNGMMVELIAKIKK